MEKANQVLKDVFGLSSFRLSQEAVVRRLLVDNENALVVYPTGGGKSLTYQLPALCLEGLTLVVSPLLALMRDQVDALCRKGVKAASLDSTLTAEKSAWVKQEVLSGALKILYVAPERLNNESFMNLMTQVKISLLAVDESHCISQWGASFRPEYLKIARFAEERDVERVLCLTATATKSVAMDICKSFLIHETDGVFRIPVYRPNLAFQVEVANSIDDKLKRLVPFLNARTGPAIVYVTLQKHAEDVATRLKKAGIEAMVYHAGLPSQDRERIQNEFMDSEKGVVCATIAFGMGIDKANIRQVIHLYMPKTIENYSQEVGRAGRDGLPSTCLLFLSAPDIPILEGFARGDTCARKDLELWLQEVFMKIPSSDGTIDANLYEQAKLYDIRSNVLNLCYAQLELDYNYIRAVTPFYSIYDISELSNDGLREVMSCNTAAAKVIRTHWKRKTSSYQIDVVAAATYENIDRAELARQLNDWEFKGLITSKASQVRARYLVLKPLPSTTEEIRHIAALMHERMEGREQEAVEKLRQVVTFATADDCLAQSLAAYFGDVDAVPEGMCGTCSFCNTGAGIEFNSTAQAAPNPAQIAAILQACTDRDDPRHLARMAFGITSPRLTLSKLSTSHPLFGSMGNVDFNALVAAFDVECKKAGYTRSTAPASTTTKRTWSQSSSSTQNRSSSSSGRGGYRGGSRGGYAKRPRRGY
ncbi:ATP-dependent DNA helicase [Dentipellis sp. KUC8613]|nr:ATP-dependent DNA helicase [Dentipellis sp. KUC8613]